MFPPESLPAVRRSGSERTSKRDRDAFPCPSGSIGFITNNNSSETVVRKGRSSIPPHIETVAKAHENAGFDRALLAFHSTTPDALQIAQHVLGVTDSLNVLIAQRPGFTAPTLLARQLAVLDQFSRGRVALHVITGGNATELRQDGNTLDDKDERYARTSEFLDVLKLEWTSDKPFTYKGKYYQGREWRSRRCSRYRPEGIPIYFGGGFGCARSRSPASMPTPLRCGANPMRRCATSPRASATLPFGRDGRRRASASRCGRSLPPTEKQAWRRRKRFWRAPPRSGTRPATASPPTAMPQPARERLLSLADRGSRIDKRLLDRDRQAHRCQQQHHRAGRHARASRRSVRRLLRSRHQPLLDPRLRSLIDAIEYGRELIPLTRELVAKRRAVRGGAAE